MKYMLMYTNSKSFSATALDFSAPVLEESSSLEEFTEMFESRKILYSHIGYDVEFKSGAEPSIYKHRASVHYIIDRATGSMRGKLTSIELP